MSMPIVTWCDKYSVNVEEIDIQHKKILELVNNLHSSVENFLDKQELARLLIELVDFTRMHFRTEEQLMKKYDYPELIKHQTEHKILLQHLDNLVAAVSRGKYPTFYSDYDVSSDWALIHISESDKRFGSFLNSKSIY
jgi:hemerythrin-like metal-binding protein